MSPLYEDICRHYEDNSVHTNLCFFGRGILLIQFIAAVVMVVSAGVVVMVVVVVVVVVRVVEVVVGVLDHSV